MVGVDCYLLASKVKTLVGEQLLLKLGSGMERAIKWNVLPPVVDATVFNKVLADVAHNGVPIKVISRSIEREEGAKDTRIDLMTKCVHDDGCIYERMSFVAPNIGGRPSRHVHVVPC